MNYENIKSVILTILVMISLLLYYILWTDQGGQPESLNSVPTLEPVMIGQTKELSQIIKPDRIYQHINGQHYGTISTSEIDALMETMKTAEFGDFHNISGEIEDLSTFLKQQNNSLEISFPGEVPFSLYKNFLNIEESNNFDFDTIFISYATSGEKKAKVYFLSKKDVKVYESTVPDTFIDSLVSYKENINSELYSIYFSYQPNDHTLLYLPTKETDVIKYKYLSKTIESSKLKSALFSDPSLVQKSIEGNMEEFTDVSGLLRIDKDSRVVTFFKPSGTSGSATLESETISNSIDFVNKQGGWISDYLYVGKSELEDEVNFRIYNSGYPIFDLENNISEIHITWENAEVKQFVTNNIEITGTAFDSSTDSIKSGKKVAEYFNKNNDLDKEQLQNIVIGYDMTVDSQGIVYLTPGWFYQYNEKWYQVNSGDAGGNQNGLE